MFLEKEASLVLSWRAALSKKTGAAQVARQKGQESAPTIATQNT